MSERLMPAEFASAEGSRTRSAALRLLRGRSRVIWVLFIAVSLAGCHHRNTWTPPAPGSLAPVELPALPQAENLPEIATETPPVYEPPSPPPTAPRPVRRRPTPPRESSSNQPDQPAAGQGNAAAEPDNSEVAELAIGSLSSGGDSTPQNAQQARDLITQIQKRIAALPRSVASQQRNALRQVNNFLKHAQQALDSGDAEGAMNLANKARLVMDDIEKK